jgi:hypothetical protein
MIDPDPFSPLIENLTNYLVVSIVNVSAIVDNSLQSLVNSNEDKVTIDAYSVSGIPNYSESN